MKNRILKLLTALFSTVLLFAAAAAAEDFEGMITEEAGGLIGADALFRESTIPVSGFEIKTEGFGSYTNSYLSVSGTAGVLVGQKGVLQNEETLIKTRVKFSAGSGQEVILRSYTAGSSDVSVLSFDGKTKVRLFGSDSYDIGYTAGSWYDLYFLVNKNTGIIRAAVVKEKNHSVINAVKTLTSTQSKYLDSNCCLRFKTQGTNELCIDDVTVGDASCREVDIAKEDFERFSEGALSKTGFSSSGMQVLSQYFACADIIGDNGGRQLKITGSAEQKNPFIYNLLLPDGVSILEFDMKVSPENAGAYVFLRSSTGSQAGLVLFDGSTVKVCGSSHSELADRIGSEFIHFAFLVTQSDSQTTVKAYTDGSLCGYAEFSGKFNDARFLVNYPNLPEDYSESSLYLDNIRVYAGNLLGGGVTGSSPVYIDAETGSDLNDGRSSGSPLKTLAAAYELADTAEKLIIMKDMSYAQPPSREGMIVLEGADSSVKLTLPEAVGLTGGLTMDNITLVPTGTYPKIYANGFELVIGENAVSERRLEVYGGSLSDLTADTHITLLGGQYSVVYGGCQTGKLTGNTYVTVGGSANKNDSTNDSDSSFYASYLHGGGNKGAVSGTTNISFGGNAVFAYIIGAGKEAAAAAAASNIKISGGRVLNIYGGSLLAPLDGYTADITMTGGVAEGIFGGSHAASIIGSTCVTLLGGEVTRRVYTGCYDSGGNNYVTGTTALVLTPGAKVNTGTGLSASNRANSGVFAGSRGAGNAAESNMIIFADGCYDDFKEEIGDVSGWGSLYQSKEKYIIKAGTGGSISGAGTAGGIVIVPYEGRYALINGTAYFEETAVVEEGVTEIAFAAAPDICTVSAQADDGGVKVKADIATASEGIYLLAAVYTADGSLAAAGGTDSKVSTGSYTVDIACAQEDGYYVKVMLWDAAQTPVSETKRAEITR